MTEAEPNPIQAGQPYPAQKGRFLVAHAGWRRKIPAFLLPLLVELRVLVGRRTPHVLESARLQMRFLLERTRPEADLDRAARGYMRQMYWRAERRWRPQMIDHQPVDGVEQFLAARDPERGLILTFVHHANFDGAWASLDRVGIHCHALAAAFLFYPGQLEFLKQHLRVLQQGATLINSDEGADGIRAALAKNAVVAMAPDVGGSTPVEYVGRKLIGSFGTARLALETNSQVCVATFHKDRKAPARIRLSKILEPGDFPDGHALLTEILRRHEASVLDWPEAADRPMQRWAYAEEEERELFGDPIATHPL